MASSSLRTRKVEKACDRCYELKERCARASLTISCTRCDRLSLICSTVRPVRPAGRKRQAQKPPVFPSDITPPSSRSTSSSSEHDARDIGAWLQDVPSLSTEEKDLLRHLLGRPQNMEYYVVSPSFQAAEQNSLAAALQTALPVLKDAYLACAGSLKALQRQAGTASEVEEAEKDLSLSRASSAMVILRSLPVANARDAALCLTLGTALVLFVYSVIGVGVPDICSYCLSVTSPYMDAENDADMKQWQSFLVLQETMECLVYRRKPTLRLQTRQDESVDRHLGLCVPLMPHYYDLCVISNSMLIGHSMVGNADANYLAQLQKQLEGIHAAVEEWQPSHPSGFMDRFESADIISLLAQARVYRLGCLLVGHRLRYPFGEKDCQADIWSKEIMMELELAHRVTKQPIRCVTLPFIAAAIEIRNPNARITALQKVDEYVDQFTPVVQKATKIFLERVWHERDLKITTRWFESVHKPCATLDAICFA